MIQDMNYPIYNHNEVALYHNMVNSMPLKMYNSHNYALQQSRFLYQMKDSNSLFKYISFNKQVNGVLDEYEDSELKNKYSII